MGSAAGEPWSVCFLSSAGGAWLPSPWVRPPGVLLSHLRKPMARAFSPSKGLPGGLLSDFIKPPGPTGFLLVPNGKGFRATIALKAQKLLGRFAVCSWLSHLPSGMWNTPCLLHLPRPGLKAPSLPAGKQESWSIWGDQAEASLCLSASSPFLLGAWNYGREDHLRSCMFNFARSKAQKKTLFFY